MKSQDVHLLRRGEVLVVATVHSTPTSNFLGDPVERLDMPLAAESMGQAVVRGLERGREFPQRPDGADADMLAALGVTTWKQLSPDTSSVAVGRDRHRYSIVPMRTLGPGDGFDFQMQHEIEMPARVPPAQLGEKVLAAFELAGPAPQASPRLSEAHPPGTALLDDLLEMAGRAADALRADGYRADHTLESLADVDRFSDAELRRPGRPRRRGALAEHTGAKLLGIAGYLGETLRQRLDARWRVTEDMDETEIEMELPDGSVIWPVRRVMARYQDGPEASLAAYARSLAV